jgi:Fe-S-cluster-containing hydrogenase component 2
MSSLDVSTGLKITGAPSMKELKASSAFPNDKILKERPIIVIECVEKIPCNPCETACPKGAIVVGDDITSLPALNVEKCIACGLCIAVCPGLAIFLRDYNFDDRRCTLKFPYEYYPLPEEGQNVSMADRFGEIVCEGEVLKVQILARNDKTAVITAAYEKRHFLDVITMKRL